MSFEVWLCDAMAAMPTMTDQEFVNYVRDSEAQVYGLRSSADWRAAVRQELDMRLLLRVAQ